MWHQNHDIDGLSLHNWIIDNTNIQRKIKCNVTYNFNNMHVKDTMLKFVFPELGRLNNNVDRSKSWKGLLERYVLLSALTENRWIIRGVWIYKKKYSVLNSTVTDWYSLRPVSCNDDYTVK